MEPMIHNDYRQQPITSDEASHLYREYLARLESMVVVQEDVVMQARMTGAALQLARARTTLWRLLTKRQGVVDAISAYEGKHAHQSAQAGQ